MLKRSSLKAIKKRRVAVYVTIYLLLLAAAVLYTTSVYKHSQFGDAQVDEIMYYLTNGLSDGKSFDFLEAVRDNLLLLLILFFLLLLPVIDFYRDRITVHFSMAVFGTNKSLAFNPSRVPLGLKLAYAIVAFLISLWIVLSSFHAISYIISLTQTSHVFEEHYVDPRNVKLEFPAKKRNLVYIYMESMENTPASTANGGQMTPSRIPELEKLALDPDNIAFSNHPSGLGGALPATGTTWTVAGMTAQSSGTMLRDSLFGLGQNGQGALSRFLPGSYGLGEVLAAEGYSQSFIMGSQASFGGRDKLLNQHGDYRVMDLEYMKKAGKLPSDYSVWWGFEDRKLFEFGRQEATRLASEGKPFNLQLLTADTHFTDGYLDPTCPTPFKVQYDNVHACSSARVAEFVRWIQAQPFGANTTIILTGDHLGMQTAWYDGAIKTPGYQRTVYNAFVNPAIKTEHSHGRLFTTFDMYPTTLAALGVRVPGEHLGLGVNLFSGEPTLLETYGSLNALNEELGKRSQYYEKHIVNGQ